MKKKYFLLISLFIFLLSFTSIGQNTFNKDIKIMKFINQTGPITMYDDTLICLGNGVDHDTFDIYAAYFAKLDKNGNISFRSTDSVYQSEYYYTDINKCFKLHDTLITTADFVKGKEEIYGYLMMYSLTTGQLLKKIDFHHKYKWMFITDMVKISDSIYAISMDVQEIAGINNTHDIQISIINVRSGAVKNIDFGVKDRIDLSYCMFWTGQNFLIGTVYIDPPVVEYDYKKRNVQGVIYKVDTSGNFTIAYKTDTLRGPVVKIIKSKYGDYICLSTFIVEEKSPLDDKYYGRYALRVFKIDSQFNFKWEKQLGYDFYLDQASHYAKIINSIEGDGYIVAGYQPNYHYNLSIEEADSLTTAGNPPMQVGILEKIDEDGTRKWFRTYTLIDKSLNPLHNINDITPSGDGGYYLYGTLYYAPLPDQNRPFNSSVWLLKVDAFGCLVPGCQLNDDTSSTDKNTEIKDFMIYPNPVNDVLYIYDELEKGDDFTISDFSGREIYRLKALARGHTYIVKIEDLKNGIYVVSRTNKHGIRTSRKFVVNRG